MIDWLIGRLSEASAWLRGRALGGQDDDPEDIERVAVYIGKDSYCEAETQRIEDSMSLHDPETYGYILMMLKRPKDADRAEIVVCAVTRPAWNAAFGETARRITEAVESVRANR